MSTHEFKNSSALSNMHHDEKENVLTVTFHSGKTYQYANFTKEDFEEFKQCKSPGSHFAQNIKGRYDLI